MEKEKYMPTVGEHLYITHTSGNWCLRAVRRPYTVISANGKEVTIQSAKLIFNGPVYYDTIADDIQEDPNGRIVKLHYSRQRGVWQLDEYTKAVFGRWDHYPYLD